MTTPVTQELLKRARAAIRRGLFDLAEALVHENGEAIWSNAACLNVLGLVAEARGQWKQAWRLRRYFELFHWGRCRDPVAFGDEPEFQGAGQEVRS